MIKFESGSYFQVVPNPDPTVLFKPGQLNNWQILCVDNGTSARLLQHFQDFQMKYVCSQRAIKGIDRPFGVGVESIPYLFDPYL
jgi:hypothetical protein